MNNHIYITPDQLGSTATMRDAECYVCELERRIERSVRETGFPEFPALVYLAPGKSRFASATDEEVLDELQREIHEQGSWLADSAARGPHSMRGA